MPASDLPEPFGYRQAVSLVDQPRMCNSLWHWSMACIVGSLSGWAAGDKGPKALADHATKSTAPASWADVSEKAKGTDAQQHEGGGLGDGFVQVNGSNAVVSRVR